MSYHSQTISHSSLFKTAYLYLSEGISYSRSEGVEAKTIGLANGWM